jgi:antitoxin VapB
MLTSRHPEVERLAHELATQRGLPVDDVLLAALRAEWAKMNEPYKPVPKPLENPEAVLAKVRKIVEEIDKLPVLDDRSPDEILGYNEIGAFDGHR